MAMNALRIVPAEMPELARRMPDLLPVRFEKHDAPEITRQGEPGNGNIQPARIPGRSVQPYSFRRSWRFL